MTGGFGSGRPSGFGRGTVESRRSIDVNRLQRAGCLEPGWTGGWQWTNEGKQTAWIRLTAGIGRVNLNSRVRIADGEWQDVDEDVRLIRKPCRFGGTRAYFVCPGVVNGIPCSRTVAKLHGAGRYFLCRHCYQLAYASQSEDALDRSRRRVRKIRGRLGGDANLLVPFPQKPKGMWTSTYTRMRRKALKAEIHTGLLFESKAASLLARVKGLDNKRSFW